MDLGEDEGDEHTCDEPVWIRYNLGEDEGDDLVSCCCKCWRLGLIRTIDADKDDM